MNCKLITWSLNVTHLYFDEEITLSNGAIVPKGTLCGRFPKRKGRMGTFGGKTYDFITLAFGSKHLRWGRMSFCMNCQRIAAKYHTDKVADELGLPEQNRAQHAAPIPPLNALRRGQ